MSSPSRRELEFGNWLPPSLLRKSISPEAGFLTIGKKSTTGLVRHSEMGNALRPAPNASVGKCTNLGEGTGPRGIEQLALLAFRPVLFQALELSGPGAYHAEPTTFLQSIHAPKIDLPEQLHEMRRSLERVAGTTPMLASMGEPDTSLARGIADLARTIAGAGMSPVVCERTWAVSSHYGDRIRQLITQDRVSDARALVDEALGRDPHDPQLNRLKALLALPKTRQVRRPDADRTDEFRWLAQHSKKYQGEWVAILGSKLVAHAPTLKELRRTLAAHQFEVPPLVHRIG